MKLEGYKLVFIALGLIGVLLIATPILRDLIRPPVSAQFSELYLLGPDHKAENYPFNVDIGENYSVYVDIENHLGSSAYYILYIRFGNETDFLPNLPLENASLTYLYEYRFSIKDNMNWESLLNFSISDASISTNNSKINTFQINGLSFYVDKPANWDSSRSTFKYQLIFELWIYNVQKGYAEYNDRYVNLQLNLIQTV